MSSCTEDIQLQGDGTGLTELDEGELSEVRLNLSVNPLTVDMHAGTRASEPSNTPEEETAAEREIHDIWVFQYNATTKKILIKPRYYTITDQSMLSNLPVQLRTDVGGKSVVYVIANTGDSDWANDGTDASWQDFSTLDQLTKADLPEPFPVQVTGEQSAEGYRVSIPMGGSTTANVTAANVIEVPVTRMYAKLKIKVTVGDDLKNDLTVESTNIREIPWYCRIETLEGENGKDAEGEPLAVGFPENTQFISRAFAESNNDEDEEGWLVIYVPETIRGETNAENKNMEQPDNALAIDVHTRYNGSELVYTVYPGGNDTDNFNILRNCVYRVKININTIDTEQHQPSANCFIVKENGFLAFEPYYRVEEGGGYDFKDYLNPDVEDLRIDKVEIIWQTKNCIGDNTNGDLVYLEKSEPYEHQKIYVKTNEKGNALIAARNKKGDVIWSWHIWVTNHEPDNLGKAVVYTTYAWDENGIYTNNRIPGYAVMSCNLGALADTPEGKETDAFGLLYQWGRKDPFPPITTIEFDGFNYSNDVTDSHYGNDNNTIVKKTSYTAPEEYLFHSVIGSSLKGAVRYSIANPTVFICGTNEVMFDYDNVDKLANYFNEGDWCPNGESDDKLWGGLPPSRVGMKYLEVSSKNNIHIFDNYGEKSIFDPCPRGWRVAPGELWLEFSRTGYNPNGRNEVNYDPSASVGHGMMMYMQAWREGKTSFFPMQGTRVGGGGGIRVGTCGNYHNATTDENNRVNILHIHNDDVNFHIFEDSYPMYFVKSTAGPIRCVRDSK